MKKFANFSTKSTNYENKNQLIQKTRVPAGFTFTLGSGRVFQTDENSGSGSFGYQKITNSRVGFSSFLVPDRALVSTMEVSIQGSEAWKSHLRIRAIPFFVKMVKSST